MSKELQEGIDYYYDQQGMMVLTKEYLLRRGRCCFSGCRHCPYGTDENCEADIPQELTTVSSTWDEKQEEAQRYLEEFEDSLSKLDGI